MVPNPTDLPPHSIFLLLHHMQSFTGQWKQSSPGDSSHTGRASLRCGSSCVSPCGTSGWTSSHTRHSETASHLRDRKGKLETKTKQNEIQVHTYCSHSSLTSVDLLVSLEEILLNEAHVTLAALKRLLTWTVWIIYISMQITISTLYFISHCRQPFN